MEIPGRKHSKHNLQLTINQFSDSLDLGLRDFGN